MIRIAQCETKETAAQLLYIVLLACSLNLTTANAGQALPSLQDPSAITVRFVIHTSILNVSGSPKAANHHDDHDKNAASAIGGPCTWPLRAGRRGPRA